MERQNVEPWLRGTLTEVEPVRRQVLHALELAGEDAERWCSQLSTSQMHHRPFDVPSVAFHLRHIARSLDRLLTYAEGRMLSAGQRAALAGEMDNAGERETLLREFSDGLRHASARVLAIHPAQFAEIREVGRDRLRVPVAGLLIHCAEHTQRHAGQMVTTAKIVRGASSAAG